MDATEHNGFPPEYEIIRKIGRGGTADIFLARPHGLARPVILKRFYDPAAVSLVERETAVAARVRFPGIVRVHRAGKTPDAAPFLEMEYCPGPTLEKLIGVISEQKLLALLSSVAASLHVLHTAGLLHNDLKPSNIFCPPGYEDDRFPLDTLHYLKLADFSLSGIFPSGRGARATGTVGYMSPEMIAKGDITPQSDLFSLGIMAYQLACGRLPFISDTNDPQEINAQISESPRPPLCGPGRGFSTGTAELVHALIEINRASRPPSAFALLDMLDRLGSPYPYRAAIRPKHLLWGVQHPDADTLTALFGENSFSPKQLDYIARNTGFETAALRIFLEGNFDRGNFVRGSGRWGWKNDSIDCMEWSHRQIRFALRPLRGAPVSVKQAAMATAILRDEAMSEAAAGVITGDKRKILEAWQKIPADYHPSLLHSLDQCLGFRTRRILSARLAASMRDTGKPALIGSLLFFSGQYEKALDLLVAGADAEISRHCTDESFRLLSLAVSAAQKLGNVVGQASVLLKRARLEKDLGMLPASEKTYYLAVDLLETTNQPAMVAQACKELGDLYKAKTDYQSGIKVLARALELYRQSDDILGLSHTLNNLGNMYWIAGQLDLALEHYQEALAIQKELRSEKEIATSLNNIGTIHVIKGDYADGLSNYQQSLDIRTRLGDKGPISQTWNNLGATYFLMGDAARAAESFDRSLQLSREIGARVDEMFNLENLAEAMIQAGRLSEGLTFLKEGSVLAEKLGETSHISTVDRLTGQLLRRMGYYDEAEAALRRAHERARSIDNKALVLQAEIELARLYRNLGETQASSAFVESASAIAAGMGDKSALLAIALIRLAQTGSDVMVHEAERLFAGLNTSRDRALLNLSLLEHYSSREDMPKAAACLDAAREFFTGHTEDVDLARFHLDLGSYFILAGDCRLASEHAREALAVSRKLSLLPEQWQAAAQLSELTFAKRDYEASFAHARLAAETLKKIASHIKDAERLGRVYDDARVTGLLSRIKSLQSLMGKIKGAAIGSP